MSLFLYFLTALYSECMYTCMHQNLHVYNLLCLPGSSEDATAISGSCQVVFPAADSLWQSGWKPMSSGYHHSLSCQQGLERHAAAT